MYTHNVSCRVAILKAEAVKNYVYPFDKHNYMALATT